MSNSLRSEAALIAQLQRNPLGAHIESYDAREVQGDGRFASATVTLKTGLDEATQRAVFHRISEGLNEQGVDMFDITESGNILYFSSQAEASEVRAAVNNLIPVKESYKGRY